MIRKVACALPMVFLSLATQPAAAQSNQYHDRMAVRIAERQQALRDHTRAMEKITDPARLQAEMLRHFKMVEDLMALILEHKRVRNPKAVKASLDQLAAHSRGMESIRDSETLSREMVKHQQMVDRVLELLQKR